MKVALTGDVMLGRLVNRLVVTEEELPPTIVWGDLLPLLLSADLRLINLECVISQRGQAWRPDVKLFHFRAHPRAIDVLCSAHIDCVNLANNHVLDFGPSALQECLALLDQAHIKHAGAGMNMWQAAQPAFLECADQTIAVIGITDNEPAWEADSSPGTNFIGYDARGLLEPYLQRLHDSIRQARERAGVVIVSAHVGPNWGPPSAAMRSLAHQIIELGADLYWGHSNHTPQAIEVYRGKFIMYSTGDFIDDYAVDPQHRNDLSFLFNLSVEDRRIKQISALPSCISDCCVRRADEYDSAFLSDRMQAQCLHFGTTVGVENGVCEFLGPRVSQGGKYG